MVVVVKWHNHANQPLNIFEYELAELGCSAIHLIDWNGLSLETRYSFLAAISKNITAVGWSPMSNT